MHPNPPNAKTLQGHEDAYRQHLLEQTIGPRPTVIGPFTDTTLPFTRPPPIISAAGAAFKGQNWKNRALLIAKDAQRRGVKLNLPPDWLKLTGGGKVRWVHNGSGPYVRSVGFGKWKQSSTPSDWALNRRQEGPRVWMLYSTVTDIQEMIANLGPGTVVISGDVKGAFRTLNIPLKSIFSHMTSVVTRKYGREYFVMITHTFGNLDAEAGWQLLANVIAWIATTDVSSGQHAYLLKYLIYYVDNFWFFLPPHIIQSDPNAVEHAKTAFDNFFQDLLGAPMHEQTWTTEFDAIGWAFSTQPPGQKLKPGRHALAIMLLDYLLANQSSTIDADLLDGTKSLFAWIGAGVPVLKVYIKALFDVNPDEGQFTPEIWSSITFLRNLLANGIIQNDGFFPIQPWHKFGHPPDHHWRTDASCIDGAGVIHYTKRTLYGSIQ